MKFRGQRNPAPDLRVYVFLSKAGVERPFSPAWSQKVVRFSDDFEWGFARQGSKQLALALLLEVTGDFDVALTCYHDFDRSVVSHLPHKKWELRVEEIRRWVCSWQATDFQRL